MSAASNARKRRRLGSASANHGRSQTLYCGEYTLLVNRKISRMGKPRVQRGKPGWRRPLTVHTIATHPTNNTNDPRLTRRVLVHPKPVACSHTTNHRLSQSAGRDAL